MPTHDEWKHINEARANYIAKRNRENEAVEALTPDQHDALQYVCSARHALHVGHEAMFISESAEYRELWCYLTEGDAYSINITLVTAGLPKIEGIDLDLVECPSDEDWYLLDDDEQEEYDSYDDWYEDAYNGLSNRLAEVNSKIENYLRRIDEEYGTNYAPTGAQRI